MLLVVAEVEETQIQDQMVELEHQETLVDLEEETLKAAAVHLQLVVVEVEPRVKVLMAVKQLVDWVAEAAVVPVKQVAKMIMDLFLPIHQEHTIMVVMVVMVCKFVLQDHR